MKGFIALYIGIVFVICIALLGMSIKSEIDGNKKVDNKVAKNEVNIPQKSKQEINLENINKSDIISEKIEEDIDNIVKEETFTRELREGEYYGKSVYAHYEAQKNGIESGTIKFIIIDNDSVIEYKDYEKLLDDIKEKDIFTKTVELYPNQALKSYTFTKVND